MSHVKTLNEWYSVGFNVEIQSKEEQGIPNQKPKQHKGKQRETTGKHARVIQQGT